MRCFHLLVGLTLALSFGVSAEAGGSYGSYGSYGSGGSSGGVVHGSSGGGLLSGLRARIAARHASHGSSGGSSGGYTVHHSASSGGASSGGASSGGASSGGSSGGGLFSRLKARIAARRAASSHGSSGGYTASYSSGGASSGGSSGGYYSSSHSHAVHTPSYASSGGHVAPVSYSAPVIHSAPMIHSSPMIESSYPIESYSAPSFPSEGSVIHGSSVPMTNSAPMGGAVIDGAIINSGASYESRKPTLDDDAALLTVAVPVEGARVTVNGHETTSDGMVRQFMSRGLKDGYLYTYEVVVVYDVDGREMKDTKTIKLRPGDMERMVFIQEDEAASTDSDKKEEATSEETQVSAPAKAESLETVVQLRVPADAKVSLAGNDTNGFGRIRTFRTTQLAAGQSWKNYTVVVTTNINGKTVSQERTIDVAAGEEVELDFDFNSQTLAMR